MKLTDLKIKKIKATGKDYTKSDGNNLYIRVDPNGNKSFLYIYTKNKKRNVVTIGKYPLVSLMEAREASFNIKKDISKGIDPKLTAINPKISTFKCIAEDYIVKIRKDGLTDSHIESSIFRLNRYIYPVIGDVEISEITPAIVVSLLRRIEKLGYLRQRDMVKEVMSCVFKYAIASGLCLYNPTRDISAALIKKKKRNYNFIDPVKNKDDAMKLIADVFNIDRVFIRSAFKLLVYTALRPNEIMGLSWDEIEKNKIRIKPERMKMRVEHAVPLSNQAQEVVEEMREITGSKNFVFHSAASKKLNRLSIVALQYALHTLGYKGKHTTHGFRHLISTALHELSNKYQWRAEAIEMCLAHKDKNQIRATYNKYDYFDERKEIMQVWADYLDLNITK